MGLAERHGRPCPSGGLRLKVGVFAVAFSWCKLRPPTHGSDDECRNETGPLGEAVGEKGGGGGVLEDKKASWRPVLPEQHLEDRAPTIPTESTS